MAQVDIQKLLKDAKNPQGNRVIAEFGDAESKSTHSLQRDERKLISVDISSIGELNLVRTHLRENVVKELATQFDEKKIGNQQRPSIRLVNPDIDGEVPEHIKYIVVQGHHRIAAMRLIAEKDPEKSKVWKFDYLPTEQFKSKLDVLRYQVVENTSRAGMSLYEIGQSVLLCKSEGMTKNVDISKYLYQSPARISRALRCVALIPATDMKEIASLGLDSEDSLLNIARIIELDCDWRILLNNAIDQEIKEQGELTSHRSRLLANIIFEIDPKKQEAREKKEQQKKAKLEAEALEKARLEAEALEKSAVEEPSATSSPVTQDQDNSTKDEDDYPTSTPLANQQNVGDAQTPPKTAPKPNDTNAVNRVQDVKAQAIDNTHTQITDEQIKWFVIGLSIGLTDSEAANDLQGFIERLDVAKIAELRQQLADNELYHSLIEKLK